MSHGEVWDDIIEHVICSECGEHIDCEKGCEYMNNSLMVIQPYKRNGMWLFDDPTVGLVAEPFVSGIPEMIETLVEGMENAETGFSLCFSNREFAGATHCLKKVADDLGGAWYRASLKGERRHGWLCPALLNYFPAPPEQIWVSAC